MFFFGWLHFVEKHMANVLLVKVQWCVCVKSVESKGSCRGWQQGPKSTTNEEVLVSLVIKGLISHAYLQL